ncbi:MAG: FAD-dependent oxidoreductase, partial [Planctomycetota bacterium]|nr:FAD-dependent oxidoreductase [Planctomycetota bacterium]
MQGKKIVAREYAELADRRALLEMEWPPCRAGCPVHADVRGYVELIARGRYRDALALIMEVLPFPSVCGRICHHPCEQACRRNGLDEPIAIRELKRFVAEYPYPEPLRFPKPVQDRGKVAIVGAGPSGLTAAMELSRRGYRPAVFDCNGEPGGLLATAVPAYRLPREVLRKDTDAILSQGVEFRGGIAIGKDMSFEDLRRQGFKAIVLAVGLSKSRLLPVPGADAEGIHTAIPFLAAANAGRLSLAGRHVAVIGGGNVAIDVARSALRAGAASVRMVCVEDEKEQPAWPWEKKEAADEGVITLHRLGPGRILTDSGKVAGVEFRRVLSVFDPDGRFNPKYDDSVAVSVPADTVVFAVGQEADLSFLDGSGVEKDARGRLVFDRVAMRTSATDVFACGEVVTGPGSAVEAVASGRRAALAVDAFLRGDKGGIPREELPPKIGELPVEWRSKISRGSRARVPERPPAVRKKDFEPVDRCLSENVALAEARRCMSCGAGAIVLEDKCAACLTCLRVCPFGIPVVDGTAEIHSYLCQACGMCAAECPNNAIIMAGFAPDAIRKGIRAALESVRSGGPRIAVIS